MVCPTDSPSSRGFLTLVNNGTPPSPEKRRVLYYTICIMLRLLIAGIVLQYCDSLTMQIIVCIASAISALYLLFVRKDTTQWWSSTFQTGIAISLFLVSLILIISRVSDEPVYVHFRELGSYALPALLYLSVVGGVAQSLFIESC
jgi:hypothetical protein